MIKEENACEFVKKNGERCGAAALKRTKGLKPRCFWHTDDKEASNDRKKALKKAAESKAIYLPLTAEDAAASIHLPKKINLSKSKDIRRAYTSIIKAAFLGGLDKATVGTLTYALNGYCAQLDKLELLERVEKLERHIKRMGKRDEY